MCLYGHQKEESTSRQPNELYNLQVPRHKKYIAQISVSFNIKIDQYLLLGSARRVTSRNCHAPTSRMNEAGKGTSTSSQTDKLYIELYSSNISCYRHQTRTYSSNTSCYRHQTCCRHCHIDHLTLQSFDFQFLWHCRHGCMAASRLLSNDLTLEQIEMTSDRNTQSRTT